MYNQFVDHFSDSKATPHLIKTAKYLSRHTFPFTFTFIVAIGYIPEIVSIGMKFPCDKPGSVDIRAYSRVHAYIHDSASVYCKHQLRGRVFFSLFFF